MEENELKDAYDDKLKDFVRLEKAIKATFEYLIQAADIPYLTVSGRIKDFKSLRDKCERKGYENPFEDNEDFIGIRIITYFLSNISDIEKIIQTEKFVVVSSFAKEDELGDKEFGYRSTHFILKIPPAWAKTPSFRGLENIKIEIQLRTVLMHAWAEVEHKLQYKGEHSTPSNVRRKFGRIAAKLEESDEQFEEIIESVGSYVEKVESEIADPKKTEFIEINTETIRVFCRENMNKYAGYNKYAESRHYSALATELGEIGYQHISELEKDMKMSSAAFKNMIKRKPNFWNLADVGWVRVSLKGMGKMESQTKFFDEEDKKLFK